jgi:anti-sigma regulatory factor (Ser/Thr protein kinase)
MALSISAMIHLFETKIQEKNLELIKEYDARIPDVLVGDPVRLHQIIINLVSNAVKFTTKGKITVSVKLLSEDEGTATLEFAVMDTGIGIPGKKIEKIFENFQQASSDTSRLYGGTGLGLAIVKQLLETQGGTISVQSKVDEGSTFSFILTFQKTKADAETEAEIMELYLEQTPPLVSLMKQSMHDKDWNSLYASVHKMIPSFAIMGISIDFENMAKKVQELASTQKQSEGIQELVVQLGNVCTQACSELKEEFSRIKNANL